MAYQTVNLRASTEKTRSVPVIISGPVKQITCQRLRSTGMLSIGGAQAKRQTGTQTAAGIEIDMLFLQDGVPWGFACSLMKMESPAFHANSSVWSEKCHQVLCEHVQHLLFSHLHCCKKKRGRLVLMIMSQSGCCMWGQTGSLPQSGDLQTNDHEAPSGRPLLLRHWQISDRQNPAAQKSSKSAAAHKASQQPSRHDAESLKEGHSPCCFCPQRHAQRHHTFGTRL